MTNKKHRAFRADHDVERLLEKLGAAGENISAVINKALKKFLLDKCPLCGQKIRR